MTIVATAIVAIAVVLVVAVAGAGSLAVASSRARGAADESALAAAESARDLRALGRSREEGAYAPCAQARAVAARWGVTLERCAVSSRGAVTVEVAVESPFGVVRVTARAGARYARRQRNGRLDVLSSRPLASLPREGPSTERAEGTAPRSGVLRRRRGVEGSGPAAEEASSPPMPSLTTPIHPAVWRCCSSGFRTEPLVVRWLIREHPVALFGFAAGYRRSSWRATCRTCSQFDLVRGDARRARDVVRVPVQRRLLDDARSEPVYRYSVT